MDPIQNPFVPGAGSPPPELAGRQAILDQAAVTLGRIKRGRPTKSLMIVGLRGVGKTVVLNRIQALAEEQGYLAELIEAPEHKSLPALLAPALRSLILKLDRGEQVSAAAKRAFRALRGFAAAIRVKYNDFEISLDGEAEPGVADSGDLEADLPDLLIAVGEAARERQTAVAIILDELQYLSELEMSALIMAFHKASQKQLPVVLIGAGLPQLVGLTGRSKSYAERLFDFPPAGPLNFEDASRALVSPVEDEGASITPDAVRAIFDITEGYPYFLQEWGYHAWLATDASPIDKADVERATPTALERLDRSFFRVRFDRLNPSEKRYLSAMAALGEGPHRSGDIAAKLGVKITSTGPTRASLITKGMIFSPAHGDTAFTVPLFDQFMRRTMPFEGA
ncbi:ATP-binding protein [Brevundimonas sp. PAMC22021]|uniref:ATP-binding protein n=1 Tax=Brevundimonas sp. PAMC22021 TaxID=2861285 RepID=UPI001C631748|nr:ATP-binding protein [Brevundimonas sp. PAMC22021]QYF87154.1 ATP-binding protein [Brevundimonas sp. PAMC22021]